MIVGYKLIEISTQEVIQQWGGEWGITPSLPETIRLPSGELVYSPYINYDYYGYMLIEWTMDEPPQ